MSDKSKNPLVSICCVSYNHEPYISKTIESFLSQSSRFSFEIIIHDDASNDGSAKIIEEYRDKYPELITAILQSQNQYSLGEKILAKYVLPLAKGKYIALCEGDDYWIDPYKLQKQVDFLESHPAYGMVHTDYLKMDSLSGKVIKTKYQKQIPTGDIYESLLFDSFIGTATCVFRCQFSSEITKLFAQYGTKWKMGDRVIWLYIASRSKIGYISDTTAIYRRHDTSATSFKSIQNQIDFFINSYEIRFFFINNIRDIDIVLKKRLYRKYYSKLLNYYFLSQNHAEAQKIYNILKSEYDANIIDYLQFMGSKNNTLHILNKNLIHFLTSVKRMIR